MVGSGSAGYTSDYVKASDGFHMNGASSSTARYIKYRPAYAGTLTVNYRSNNKDATNRITAIGTAVSTFTSTTENVPATVLTCGYTNGNTAQSINATLSANTDYYIFFAAGGQNIPSLQYVYTVEASDEPTSTSVSPATGAIAIGGTVQLTGSFTGGSFTGEWVSDNESVATVSNTGLVTGVAAGTAHITYQWTEDQSKDAYKAIATITVLPGFNPDGYNQVANLDFESMPNTVFTVGSSIGNIYNFSNSAAQSILPVTTEGFEYLAIQAAFDSNKGWKIVNGSGLYEGPGAERTMAIRNIKEDWVIEVYHTSGTNFYTKNDGISDNGIAKTPLVAESGHHVFKADGNGMMGFHLTKGNYVTKIIVWTTSSPDVSVTFGNTGADGGIAPAGYGLYGLFTNITLPAINQTLSKADNTQTGWTDGVNNYMMGQVIAAPVTNTTYNPVFTENTQSLARSESKTTITWDFRNTAVSLDFNQGDDGYYVKQATVNGATIDVPLYIDATATGAKFTNKINNTDWIQANNGTILNIPAIKGMTVEMNVYQAFGTAETVQTQINGSTDYALSNSNKTATYTYTGENGTIDIAIGSDIRYISTMTVTYPVAVALPDKPQPVAGEPVTWSFTSYSPKVSFTDGTSYSYTADDSSTEMRYTAGSSDEITANSYLKENGTTSTNDKYKDVDGTTIVGKSRLIRLFVTGKGVLRINCSSNIGVYNVYNSNNTKTASSGDALISSYTANTTSSAITVTNGLWIETTTKGYITSIVWTPVTDNITLTTSANMAGWRAFYDASNGYTLDANTTAYIATDVNDGVVKMKPISEVPAGTPVILKTTSSADNYKMTLTKEPLEPYEDLGNLLTWETSAVSNKYRLGYGAEGVGFYPYSGTPSSGAVILNVSSSNQARSLRMVFGSDITGIDKVDNGQVTIDSSLPVKRVVNGKLVIEKNGQLFNANGQQVK